MNQTINGGKEVMVVGFQPWKCLLFWWIGRHKININKDKQEKNANVFTV